MYVCYDHHSFHYIHKEFNDIELHDKMITGCKFDFAILTSQFPIACFDMKFPYFEIS